MVKVMAEPLRKRWQRYPAVKVSDIFGNLTVVGEDLTPATSKKNRRWLLRCTCNKMVSVLQYNLWPNARSAGIGNCGGRWGAR